MARHDSAVAASRDAGPVVGPGHLARAPIARSRPLRQVLLAAVAALAYFGIRNATAGSAGVAFDNARLLARLEGAVHIDWEGSLQSAFLGSDAVMTVANWIYIWGHWPVIIVSAVLLYRYRPPRYFLLRDAILVSAAIGFLFFAFFPVAPPRLFDASLVDTVTLHSHAYRALQPPGFTNQYAAFPSLHFGWNLLVGIAIWGATRNVALRAFAVASPIAMAFAVVMTANHFVVDVAGGLVIVLIGLAVACRLERAQA